MFYGSAKQSFWLYIRRYTCPNDKFEYSYPLNGFWFFLSLEADKAQAASVRQKKVWKKQKMLFQV